jgi:hypothetical protein
MMTGASALELLKDIGFILVEPSASDANWTKRGNILYALIFDDSLQYVGRTDASLKDRFAGHHLAKRFPELKTKRQIDLYAAFFNAPIKYGSFDVNLAAALEGSIIQRLRPRLNEKGTGGMINKIVDEMIEGLFSQIAR